MQPLNADYSALKSLAAGASAQDQDAFPDSALVRPPQKNGVCKNLDALFDASSFTRHFRPNSTVLLHGGPAEGIYRIVSGTVRCCTIDDGGERQIFAFVKKGEYIGISDIERWHFTAESIDHVSLQVVPRRMLEQGLAVNAALREEVRSLLCNMLARREQQLLSLISKKAPERLLGFLRDFAESRASSDFVVLPMCRRDIGDHLGMTTETTSRAFGALKQCGAIEMASAEKYRLIEAAGQSARVRA